MWDDYGGFYDHVPPPHTDKFGLGVSRTSHRHLALLSQGRRSIQPMI